MSCSDSRSTVTVSASMLVCAISSGRLTARRHQAASLAPPLFRQRAALTEQSEQVLDSVDLSHRLALLPLYR